jgi:CheY-like chemotaxis protein
MTANVFTADVRKCLDSGMDDVITKPIRKDAFHDKILYWLTKENTEPK